MITRNCNNCNAAYEAEPRYLNRGQGLFCSRDCSGANRTKTTAAKTPNTECAWCSAPLYRKPSLLARTGLSFCNARCQTRASSDRSFDYQTGPKPSPNSKLVKRPSGETMRIVMRECRICGKPSKKEAHQKCLNQELALKNWLSGDNSVTLVRSRTTGLPTDTKAFVKEYLLNTRGDKCEECGFDKHSPTGRSIIQMDHINGNCFDNRPENLKLLCPNCHAMTPTYGALNRDSGRAHRRKSNANI